MRSFLISCFVGFALGQVHESRPHDYVDRYHELTFEYHDRRNVLLAKTRTECYFLRVDQEMEQLLRQTSTRYALEDQVYNQIHDHTGEHLTQLNTLSSDVHDIRAAFECTLHSLYEITLLASIPPPNHNHHHNNYAYTHRRNNKHNARANPND